MKAPYLSLCFGFKVLIELFVHSLTVADPSNFVQIFLTDLLAAIAKHSKYGMLTHGADARALASRSSLTC